VGALGEALLLDEVAALSAGPLEALRGVSGLRRGLSRTFAAVSCAELSPQVLPELALRLGRSATGKDCAGRVAELGRLYQRYRSLLGPRRIDAAMAFLRGARALPPRLPALCAQKPLGGSGALSEIVVSDLHRLPPWDDVPTPHALLRAIGFLCGGAGAEEKGGISYALRVVLPLVSEERPALEQALRPILDALYQQHAWNIEVAWAPLGPEVAGTAGETAWGRFLRGLFLPASTTPLVGPAELPAEKLSLLPLPSPASESAYVAGAVRDLLRRGVAPGEIAIVAESPARKARMVQALMRYDVPVYVAATSSRRHGLIPDREGEPLPPPLALLSFLYELLGQGPAYALPREGLIQLLTTRYLRWPMSAEVKAVRPEELARALRGAGVRDLALLHGADSSAELNRRIQEWQRQQRRHGSDASSEPALLRHLEVILGELRALPERAVLGQHVAALRRLCDRLEFLRYGADPETGWLGRSPLHPSEPAEDGYDLFAAEQSELLAAECRALGRDQAALQLFDQVLDELPRRAEELRLHNEPISRSRFALLLRAAWSRLHSAAGHGFFKSGVEVSSLYKLALRPFSHLFVVGLLDSELPAPAPEDALLSDDERRLCNRLLDAPIWPLAQHAGQRSALYFAEALAHAAAVHLSWPIADEEGRPLLRSPFVEAVLHAAGRGEPQKLAQPLIPRPGQARHPTELWTRAGEALRSPTRSRTSPAFSDQALLKALFARDRRRAGRLLSQVDQEAVRAGWFSAFSAQRPDAQPGPLCGELSDPTLVAELSPRLPGSRERPLSASALEDYARCPFRFFIYRVLRAAPIPEGGDDLDPLARGNLYHKTLEAFFADRRDRGKLPLLADDDDRQALERALESALTEFAAAERGGHPALFQVRLRRLRSEIWRLIVYESQKPIEPDCSPALFEHPFGPVPITAAKNAAVPGSDEEIALHIGGVIDRIDLGPGRALVLDYKTGRLDRYKKYLRDELLSTSFQLPLYAAVVQADPEILRRTGGGSPPRVTARFYAVRQAKVTEALDAPALFALDPATRLYAGERNVAEAAYALWRRLRGGDFRIAPRTCEGCGLESVCRIAAPSASERLDDAPSDADSERTPSSATPS
jgi:RecB family exonuclease